MNTREPYRVIISGGGTGGHIYPAVAIANSLKETYPDIEILFVGAKDRMEMQKVPEAGYKIIGLWISGIQRKITIDNLSFPLKLVSSILKSGKILKKFKPHIAIGVGGFASGPLLYRATKKKIPTLIQEQNSYAGITNKLLAKKVNKICVAYDGMDKFFPKDKIKLTGNPVRKGILNIDEKRADALKHFNISNDHKTVLVIGGSNGAKTINQSLLANLQGFIDANLQLIWQTGRLYIESVTHEIQKYDLKNIRVNEFLKDMDLAYAAADIVISRAGALSISELCLVGKPVIFIPSPNVAEDHQTKNAKALVEKNAALLIKDNEASQRLVEETIRLINDSDKQVELSKNIRKLAKPDATKEIVQEIIELIN